MHITVTGTNMKMTNPITGRRLGPCDGQTAASSSGASVEEEPVRWKPPLPKTQKRWTRPAGRIFFRQIIAGAETQKSHAGLLPSNAVKQAIQRHLAILKKY
jgi:hypothetical protein